MQQAARRPLVRPHVTKAAVKNVCSRGTGHPCLREELQLDSHRYAHHMHLLCLSGEGGLTFSSAAMCASTRGTKKNQELELLPTRRVSENLAISVQHNSFPSSRPAQNPRRPASSPTQQKQRRPMLLLGSEKSLHLRPPKRQGPTRHQVFPIFRDSVLQH